MAVFPGWERALLRTIGAPVTPNNIRSIQTWQKYEGGSARFNPFNTTLRTGGSRGSYNSVGVQNYANPQAGVQATAQTLLGGHYGRIVRSLRSSADPNQTLSAVNASPWGTHIPVGGHQGPLPAFAGQPLGNPSPQPSQGLRNETTGLRSQLIQSIMQGFAGLSQHKAPDFALEQGLMKQLNTHPSSSVENQFNAGSALTGNISGNWTKFVSLNPGADRPGVSTSPQVLRFVGNLGHLVGQHLSIGTGTNHNRLTVNGRVSDHWSGHAADIPASGNALTKLGQAALILAGISPAKARSMRGGLYNVGRYQIIFNTTEGGNHFNHLHVGVR